VASLAFNVLVFGAMAGRAYMFRHGPIAHMAGGTEVGGSGNLAGFARQLPAERRRQVWALVQEERPALRALRAEVREARARVGAAVSADPFDAKQVSEAQARLLDAEVKTRTASQKLFARIAEMLTKEERTAFARYLADDNARRRHHREWRRGGSDREEPAGAAPARSQ
jgi:uncharacterized membrane protein